MINRIIRKRRNSISKVSVTIYTTTQSDLGPELSKAKEDMVNIELNEKDEATYTEQLYENTTFISKCTIGVGWGIVL